MSFRTMLFAASAASLLIAGAAQAQSVTFDNPGDTAGWTVDRYAPATFTSATTYGGRTGVLTEGTAVADGASNRPAAFSDAFYNTQGRAFAVDPGTTAMSIQLYNDPLYAADAADQRIAGFWGVAVDATDTISAYPIIELDKIDGVLTLRGWDSNGDGSWNNLSVGPGAAGVWDTLGISIVGANIDYTVNGVFAGSVDAGGSVQLQSTILQVYNTTGGVADTAHWDNFKAGVGGVPEPSAWAMMLLGFGGLGAVLRSRRRAGAAVMG